jgi:hypothetical protein
MVWQDIFISKEPKKNEVANALASVFKIPIENILIVRSIDDIQVDDNVKILCETYIVEADYKIKLSIYIRDDSLVPKNDLETIARLCEELNCEVLISDYSVNPYTMLHIGRITVDIDKYDEAEEYEME